MFNGIYGGDPQGQPTGGFGYGMESQNAGYGNEDPYSVSYYQAAAAAQYRSLGWEENKETFNQNNPWGTGNATGAAGSKPEVAGSRPVGTNNIPSSSPTPGQFYLGQDNPENFGSPAQHITDKTMTGRRLTD